jgi:MFS family permease
LIIDYWHFASRNWKHLMFGVLLIALSSFGQTFYISLFGEHIRADYQLSNTGFGTVYALATVASAFTLTWVGRWIDRTTVKRFTIGVALLLASACTLMASSPNVAFLAIALYMLRLGGQGLMVHTAQTTMARSFHTNRGKALSISALGFPLGEAFLPILVVTGMLQVGWRTTWFFGAVTVIAGAWAALRFLPRKVAKARIEMPKPLPGEAPPETLVLWTDRRLWFTLPALLATPFVGTGFFFHQASLAQDKGWSLTWVATCFVGYAIARAFALLAIGPIIDKYGAVRLLPFFLFPLGFAAGVLAIFTNSLAVPFYLAAMGISAGISSVMATSLWVELYGVQHLARVRSSVAAADVVASGLSPVAMGWLIDHGIPVSKQAILCVGGLVFVSLLSRRVRRLMPAPAMPA